MTRREREARVHDWQRVDPTSWPFVVTHVCAHCDSTYPEGSASWPCPGPTFTESSSPDREGAE